MKESQENYDNVISFMHKEIQSLKRKILILTIVLISLAGIMFQVVITRATERAFYLQTIESNHQLNNHLRELNRHLEDIREELNPQ